MSEPIRIRIMQEAYDCADRNEVEAYNSIKVMCGEVLKLAEEMVLAEREACAKLCEDMAKGYEERAARPEEYRDINPEVARIAVMTCGFVEAAIRARGSDA
jgi:hypothetical protein